MQKNHLGQPHGQHEAHPHGGHHKWHVYARLSICLAFFNVHWCTMSGASVTITFSIDLVHQCTLKKTWQIYLIRSLDLLDPLPCFPIVHWPYIFKIMWGFV